MGISFKVSKTGTRYRPNTLLQSDNSIDGSSDNSRETSRILPTKSLQADIIDEAVVGITSKSLSSAGCLISAENEVSFTLNLFPDGYNIGKPSESEAVHQATLQDTSKFLHPYDRTSETLFSAIESGRLPGDFLDDVPCKYVNGTLTCEVRDYRKCVPEPGNSVPSADRSPVINKVCLKMSMENVVKDIPLISEDTWTYGDLMEVESRILKALQPQLSLDPSPNLDRLCDNPAPTKLNLGLCSGRKKRLRQIPEVTVTSNNRIHGKKVCIDRVPESSNCRVGDSGPLSTDMMSQHIPGNLNAHNVSSSIMLAQRHKSFMPDASVPALPLASSQSKYQMSIGNPRMMQDHGSGSVGNAPVVSPAVPDMISYAENMNSSASLHGKRDNQDAQFSGLSGYNKRARLTSVGSEGIHQQQIGPHMDGLHGSDLQWKNTQLQQQPNARGIQYANPTVQRYSPQVFEGVLNQEAGAASFTAGQQGLRYGPKEEKIDTEKLDRPELNQSKNDMTMIEMETNHLDSQQSRFQQRLPQHGFMRPGFSQTPWNNFGQHIEKDSRKEDQLQKRKSAQSPRLSAGVLAQSPFSPKSAELSSGSFGTQFGVVGTTAAFGSSQKEKSAVTSIPSVGGTPSLTSSANDSMQRQQQAQIAAKRKSNSLPKTPAMSGVASPASVGNTSVPPNAQSPSVGTPPLPDQTMLERFSRIEMVTNRYRLNCKKNKADDYSLRKTNIYSPQSLSVCLSNAFNNEDYKDDAGPLSKSLICGSMNIPKTRVLNFVQAERGVQGNNFGARTRLIMSEKPSDGTVAMHYGDIDDSDFLIAEDYLPTLPNTHLADLLASQFHSLMLREGYLVDDHLQQKPTRMNMASNSQPNVPVAPPNNPAMEMQQYAEPVSSQPSNEVAKPSNSGNASLNSSQNHLPNTRMLPPGNPQALQMSQGLVPGVSMPARSQQMDPQPSLQQQQQQHQQHQQNQHSLIQQQNQHAQFQRSPLMLGTNPLSQLTIGQNSGMQLSNQMVNKPSPLQIQMLQAQQQQHQQQQQQHQHQQQQRKMMMGLGNVGMGNMGNNLAGLGNLGNVIGMGNARGMGGTGMSMPGLGNMGQNSMNLSQTSSITNAFTQQLRSGQLTHQQAQIMATKLKMASQRANMLGGPQSAAIPGMSGARQMNPGGASGLSMLGQTLNRANINPMQRSGMGPMGPPKLMTGMNLYMNQQQQQFQQQQIQQQQQLQQQLQQQQLQQQETTSPLQAVLSPQQVGSPGIQQQLSQQASPQQMSQRTPMSPQMSGGANHPMSTGNLDACPASPLGSVGSITNSPMELPGVNKSNSMGNS